GLANAHLKIHELQLLAELGVSDTQFLGDLHERLIQAKTRLHADDQQIQAVGETATELQLTAANPPDQKQFRQNITNDRSDQQKQKRIGAVDAGHQNQGDQTHGQKYLETAHGHYGSRAAKSAADPRPPRLRRRVAVAPPHRDNTR